MIQMNDPKGHAPVNEYLSISDKYATAEATETAASSRRTDVNDHKRGKKRQADSDEPFGNEHDSLYKKANDSEFVMDDESDFNWSSRRDVQLTKNNNDSEVIPSAGATPSTAAAITATTVPSAVLMSDPQVTAAMQTKTRPTKRIKRKKRKRGKVKTSSGRDGDNEHIPDNTSSASNSSGGRPHNANRSSQLMPVGFQPGNYDVICGLRGKQSMQHIGNRRYHVVISINAARYATAKTKLEKSMVVIAVVDTIRNNGGGFVRKTRDSSSWIDIGDQLAKEKVGHALRHFIHSQEHAQEEARAATEAQAVISQAGAETAADSQRDSTYRKTRRVDSVGHLKIDDQDSISDEDDDDDDDDDDDRKKPARVMSSMVPTRFIPDMNNTIAGAAAYSADTSYDGKTRDNVDDTSNDGDDDNDEDMDTDEGDPFEANNDGNASIAHDTISLASMFEHPEDFAALMNEGRDNGDNDYDADRDDETDSLGFPEDPIHPFP